MALKTTDDNYNAATRYLEQKAVIYFSSSNTLEITRDNYLVTSSVLEEAHSQSGSAPFGGVTSNELSLELLNEGGIFSPTNNKSPYYGLMKKGIKVELFIRPVVDSEDENEQYEWDPLGVYYVTDWQAKVTGLIATITANDKLYKAFSKDLTTLPISRNKTQKEFYEYIFDNLGLQGDIDKTLNTPIRYAYIDKSTKELLSTLNMSALADCFCMHDGTLKVQHLTNMDTLRATITDNDQVLSADVEQSLDYNYDDVNLTYNLPQEGDIQVVLSLKDLSFPKGISQLKNVSLTGTPLLKLCYTMLTGSDVIISSLDATPVSINITVNNRAEDVDTCDINIYGTCLLNNAILLGTENENALTVSNSYIQDDTYANIVYNHLKAYVHNLLPILELEVRGNPKLELGDYINVYSEKYNLSYGGILIKQTFDYDGSLKSTITLLNISILREV